MFVFTLTYSGSGFQLVYIVKPNLHLCRQGKYGSQQRKPDPTGKPDLITMMISQAKENLPHKSFYYSSCERLLIRCAAAGAVST
jgi:hypothetical protein